MLKTKMLSSAEKKLLDALEARMPDDGVEIVTVEIVGARKAPTIRVYIDTPHGVGFDELSHAQSWIDATIEEIDPFPGAYMLEVSSPGIDRPLRTPAHFAAQIGETAVIRTAQKINGRSKFSGTIKSADGESVGLECDGELFEIEFDQIKRANLKGAFEFR